MPRKPAVANDVMVNAIMAKKDEIVNPCNQSILGPTAQVWQKIATDLSHQVTPRYIYQYVKQNRHNIHLVLGLWRSCSTSSPVYSTSPVSETDMFLDTDEEVEQVVQPEKNFQIMFSPEEWLSIQPVMKKYKRKDRLKPRNRMILPPNCWANKIVDKLWEGHRIPCPYSITRGHVTSCENSEFIKISALCRECGATATGVILCKPVEGESVLLSWRAPDTRNVPHKRSRWLSGAERIKVGNELKRNCASLYRRELAFLKMEQGDLKPPTLWPTSVLRKAKQETRELDLCTQGHSSPIDSLVHLKYSARYAGIIHDIGIDKFFIHYYSAAQLLLYKKHRKAYYTKLSIDATGTLVKKIEHKSAKTKSGNIFLYECVMTSVPKDSPQQNLPVCQMLSEKHDTNSITYWLNVWRRAGAPVPNEVVIDNSAALKSAVARVFVGCDVKTYIDVCFSYLIEKRGTLPQTFLRLDVAHYVKAACRWAIWADGSRKRVKEFYIRCLGVLINAQAIEDFEERFRDILFVAQSPCQADSDGNVMPVTESLSRLCMVMKTGVNNLQVDEFDEELEAEGIRLPDSGEIELAPKLNEWIKKITDNIVITDDPHGQLNPYYLPEVTRHFCRMAGEFVLWSSVLAGFFGSPFMRGTSSPVESTFSDLKCNILKGESKPLKVDNFVATHIKAMEGACRIAETLISTTDNYSSHQNAANVTENIPKTDTDAEDLNFIENWRGLGVPKKAKYLSAFPEADIALMSGCCKPVKPGLLKNGSGKPVSSSNGTVFCISNTCPFDALCHLVANAYMTYQSYRDQMSQSENGFIQTAITLASKGATNQCYVQRAETLALVLEPKSQLRMPETRPPSQDVSRPEFQKFN